jgi:Peptidase propeptide and YPEB domain
MDPVQLRFIDLWDDRASRNQSRLIPRTMNVLVKSLCALLIVLAAPAWADVGRDDAAAAAQRVASGRVLSVDRVDADHHPVWRVKILTGQGEVRVILIDAASGRVVG